MKARGAVFFNREKSRDTYEGGVCRVGIVLGFVDAASDLGKNMVIAHGMLICRTTNQGPDNEGWDYDEYAITNDYPWIPRTHGSLSGSAIWTVELPVDGSARNSRILDGVVFAEGPEEDRMLITHGENSVRIVLGEI